MNSIFLVGMLNLMERDKYSIKIYGKETHCNNSKVSPTFNLICKLKIEAYESQKICCLVKQKKHNV